MIYRRVFDGLERSESDEAGAFSMTLATDGEASDGHILSIDGGRIPARMPLLVGHENNPVSQAGEITSPQKDLSGKPARLRVRGQILMDGDGAPADIRRDLALKISRGIVRGVSVRWDPIKWTPRTALPKEHPAHVKEDDPNLSKRYGLFFSEWRALEGSIVSVGADPKAEIGREFDALEPDLGGEGPVGDFWRAFVHAPAMSREPIMVPLQVHDALEKRLVSAEDELARLRSELEQALQREEQRARHPEMGVLTTARRNEITLQVLRERFSAIRPECAEEAKRIMSQRLGRVFHVR